jgi:hypothetical protein
VDGGAFEQVWTDNELSFEHLILKVSVGHQELSRTCCGEHSVM